MKRFLQKRRKEGPQAKIARAPVEIKELLEVDLKYVHEKDRSRFFKKWEKVSKDFERLGKIRESHS